MRVPVLVLVRVRVLRRLLVNSFRRREEARKREGSRYGGKGPKRWSARSCVREVGRNISALTRLRRDGEEDVEE